MYAFYKRFEYPFIALFILITQLSILPELNSYYTDTDNYTHAQRVYDLIVSRTWAETPYIHTNYPFGEILHFTRITDLFWLFFSLPAFLFFPLKEAVFWGGYIYQTGVLILSGLFFIWGIKPFTGPIVRLIGLGLFLIQPSITETYIMIKPDHHALTALFAFMTAGSLIRVLFDDQKKHLRFAGISAALCLWSSVEGLLISYLLLTGLIILFLFDRISVKKSAFFFFYYFIFSTIFLIINPPYEGFFFPDNGRLSFLLVVVIGLTTTALILLSLLEDKNVLNTFYKKLAALVLLCLVFCALVFAFFPPEVVFKPYFPPFIKEIWAKNVIELQPSTNSIPLFFLSTMPSVLAIITASSILKFCSDKERIVLILFFPIILFLGGLSFHNVRYARLACLFTPYIFVTAFCLRANKKAYPEKEKGIFLITLFILFAVYLSLNYISVNRSLSARRYPLISIVKPYLPQTEGSILSDTFLGPEIVWLLEEKVIGSPYHRNIEGISDNFWMLSGKEKLSIALMKKHRVKAILLFVNIPDRPDLFYNAQKRYTFAQSVTKNDTLMLKLLSGKDLPCGIKEELNTPAPFLLFNVDFSQCSAINSEK